MIRARLCGRALKAPERHHVVIGGRSPTERHGPPLNALPPPPHRLYSAPLHGPLREARPDRQERRPCRAPLGATTSAPEEDCPPWPSFPRGEVLASWLPRQIALTLPLHQRVALRAAHADKFVEQVWRDNLDGNGASIRMRRGSRGVMIELSLARCKPFPQCPLVAIARHTKSPPTIRWIDLTAYGCVHRYLGSLQLFASENTAVSRSFLQILCPALRGWFLKCALRSSK